MHLFPTDKSKEIRKILCFNAQGYYSSSDWLKTHYGRIVNIFPHPRRISDEEWVEQDEVKKILGNVDIWLAQEVSPRLVKLIEDKFKLKSLRDFFHLNFWEDGLPITTDIFFNPTLFEPLEFQEVQAHEKSFLKNCHKTLLVELKDKTNNKKFVVGSSHLEAGISNLQLQIRLEQLKSVIKKISDFKNEKILFGFDANDLEKRKNKLFTKVEEIIFNSGFHELINGSRTYNVKSNEIPFSWLVGPLLGYGQSLDKIAIKNLNVLRTQIINPGARVSDHNAILTEIEI